jgi:septal ring factor EnvC (AmiA/AmiB activator)
MSEDLTMRECLLRDIHDLEDQRDFAMSEMERRGCERDKARDWVFRLRKQRAIARNFGEQMERERDHWKRECLEQAKLLAMSADREEKLRSQIAALKSQISNLQSP